MAQVKQRRVPSKEQTRQLRWSLIRKKRDLAPMPRRKDFADWEVQADKELRENAKRLGVY